MARDEDAYPIACAGACHRPDCSRCTQARRQLAVADDFTLANAQQALPYTHLERRTADVQWQLRARRVAGQVRIQGDEPRVERDTAFGLGLT